MPVFRLEHALLLPLVLVLEDGMDGGPADTCLNRVLKEPLFDQQVDVPLRHDGADILREEIGDLYANKVGLGLPQELLNMGAAGQPVEVVDRGQVAQLPDLQVGVLHPTEMVGPVDQPRDHCLHVLQQRGLVPCGLDLHRLLVQQLQLVAPLACL